MKAWLYHKLPEYTLKVKYECGLWYDMIWYDMHLFIWCLWPMCDYNILCYINVQTEKQKLTKYARNCN